MSYKGPDQKGFFGSLLVRLLAQRGICRVVKMNRMLCRQGKARKRVQILKGNLILFL